MKTGFGWWFLSAFLACAACDEGEAEPSAGGADSRDGQGTTPPIPEVAQDDGTPSEPPGTEEACVANGWQWVVDRSSNGPPNGDAGAPAGPTFERCVKPCASDDDCAGTGQPFCRTLGLYQGGDFNCNGHMLICRADDRDECPR